MNITEENKEAIKALGCMAFFLFSLKITFFFVVIFFVSLFSILPFFSTSVYPTKVDAYAKVDQNLHKAFVAVNGKLEITDTIEDPFISTDDFIWLEKKVLTCAWQENMQFDEREPRKRKYTYRKHWAENPPSSTRSKKHINKQEKEILNSILTAELKIGQYMLNAKSLNLFKQPGKLINPNNYPAGESTRIYSIHEDRYIFSGKGTFENPEIGDIRISYKAINIPTDSLIIVGQMDAHKNRIVPYKNSRRSVIYKVVNNAESLSYPKKGRLSFKAHICALLVMWLCVYMITSTVSLFYNIIPWLKKGFKNDIIESGIIALIIFIAVVIVSSLFF